MGTDGDGSTNKPKWCPDDFDSKYDMTTVFGNQSGCVRRFDELLLLVMVTQCRSRNFSNKIGRFSYCKTASYDKT